MSKTNPRKAVAAFLPAPIPIPGTAEAVQPFSLATYGILEKIGSPLVMPVQGPVTALDLIPSLYVVTHDAAEVLAGDIAADSPGPRPFRRPFFSRWSRPPGAR